MKELSTDRETEEQGGLGGLRGSLTGEAGLPPTVETKTEDYEAQAQGGCRHRNLHRLDGGQPDRWKVKESP